MSEYDIIPGFMGKHSEITFEEGAGSAVDDFDPVVMARWCQNYLAKDPVKQPDWQCRFSLWALHMPVFDPWPYCASPDLKFHEIGMIDPITAGDTDSRMDYAYVYMREMAGSYDAVEQAEDGVRERVLGYIGEDNLSYVPGPIGTGFRSEDNSPRVVVWTTAKALLTQAELFRLTGDTQHQEQAQKLFIALRNLASWDTGRAFYAGGTWRNGEWTVPDAPGPYHYIVSPLVRYWEITGDSEALDFACAFADGMIANLQPALETAAVQPDGSFVAHMHCQMHAVSGLAYLGTVTGVSRYIEWTRRVYEYIRRMGTDYGWFPEANDPYNLVHKRHTEICLVADMTCTAVWLGKAGYPEYFDHAERYARNLLRHSQFFVTPELETLYRRIHSEQPAEKVEEQLAFLREIQGGFVASPTPNDLVDEDIEHHGTAGNPPMLLDLMGCCPPEGMRALHAVWENAVTQRKDSVHINMAIPCKHEAAEVRTYAPEAGRLTVLAGKECDYYLRPPSWAPRNKVKICRNGGEVESIWVGDYIKVGNVVKGEEISIHYPVVSFTQEIDLDAGVNSGSYQVHWQGNTVIKLEPDGKHLPLFKQGPIPGADLH